MTDANVSSCVLNILGSFSSSLGLYKKLRERRLRKKAKRRNESLEVEEQRLSKSLVQGPEDISREYQRSVYAVGDQFAIGDAIAQTSLAEILLRLNVGLIGIITSFLHSENNVVQLDYKGLADLSDRSRIDTCRALRQLFRRMTHFRPPLAITAAPANDNHDNRKTENSHDVEAASKINKGGSARPKIRGTTLAQVVIQGSSKPPQIALVRPGERRKKSRSSSGSESSLSKATKSSSTQTTPLPKYTPEQPRSHTPKHTKSASDVRRPHRKQSETDIKTKSAPKRGDALRAAQSMPRLDSTLEEPFDPLPPLPNTAPLLAATAPPPAAAASTPTLVLPRRRKPTPTYYSIASDSTKLGEIPLHKWAVAPDFDQMSVLNRQAYRNGWPNEPGSGDRGRKRGGLFGMFRRRTE